MVSFPQLKINESGIDLEGCIPFRYLKDLISHTVNIEGIIICATGIRLNSNGSYRVILLEEVGQLEHTIPQRKMMRSIRVYLDGNLCDKIFPGEKVMANGVIQMNNFQQTYLHAKNIIYTEKGSKNSVVLRMSDKERHKYEKYLNIVFK